MELPELHQRASAHFERVVAAVPAGAWADPTPCAEWDVRTLVNHVVAENRWVPPMIEGATIEEVGGRFDGDMLGDDPLAAYRHSASAANAAVAADGAMERDVKVSYGPVPGRVYAGHRFMDLVVHGWDLAAATGHDRTIDGELAVACWEIVQPELAALSSTPYFGDPVEVPDDAPTSTRLLAALGRDPNWQP